MGRAGTAGHVAEVMRPSPLMPPPAPADRRWAGARRGMGVPALVRPPSLGKPADASELLTGVVRLSRYKTHMALPKWRVSNADMLAHEFASVTRTFHQLVVAPACAALAAAVGTGETDAASRRQGYLGRVGAREGRKALALAMAGLWESHFREHLRKSVSIFGKNYDLTPKEVDDARSMVRLETMFSQLRGFSLDDLASYAGIRSLVQVANAARHGNGASSSTVFKRYEEYFSSEKPHSGMSSYLLHGSIQSDDVRFIEITDSHLGHFAAEIEAFWIALSELAKTGDRSDGARAGPSGA